MRRPLTLSLLLVGALAGGASPAEAGDDDEVVVRVASSSVTRAQLERRLRAMAPFQLAMLGKTPEEIKRRYVEDAVLPELLYAEEAKRRKLDESPSGADRLRHVHLQAMENEVRERVAKEEPVTPAEIKRYYDENLHRFNTPKRLKLWRILVADEAEARKLLEQVRAAGNEGTVKWSKLAREHSLDKATSMRDGDLGFVHPDGKTETPEVRVDAALFAAADGVKDGELVAAPVKEGERWAVVWRRGSMEAVSRSLAQEERTIRQILSRQKLQDAMDQLVTSLRDKHVKNVSTELLGFVDVDAMGDLVTRQRPGVVPRGRAGKGQSTPSRGDRGLR